MFRFIDRQTSDKPALRRHCLADPDVLLEIAHRAADQHGAENTELSRLFSYVLHDVRMNGVWKRTNAGRLPETEKALGRYIAPRYRNDAVILDLGASDGTTTVDLVHALGKAWGREVKAFLTDLNLSLYRHRVGPLVEYRSSNGEPILGRVGCVGLRLARGNERESEIPLLARLYLALARPLRRSMRPDVRISLVNPTAACNPAIFVKELNCLERHEELVAKFTAVRASNVLNLSYFSPSVISEVIGHLHAYLLDDGCLVVSRNVGDPEREVENGSVWLKRLDRMEWVSDFGNGSDVRQIVDSWRQRSS